jgi:hypothetical protein
VLVGGLSAGSLLLGFARDVVIAAVFGAGPELDAYLVAQGLMSLVLALVAGALANAVIPVVTSAVAAGDPRPAHRSVATALTIATAVLGAAAVGTGLLAGPILAVLAPGFDPATSTLAAKLTRIVLVATVLMAATNVLAAVAQSHHRFFWAGVQGIPFNLVMIVAAAGFGPAYGVAALAIGFIAGSAVRMLLQLVPLRQLGVRLAPSLDVHSPGLRTIAGLLPALLLIDVVASLATIIDRAVASTQGEGTITALTCGWRIVSLPNVLVITSCLTVLYPAPQRGRRRPGTAAPARRPRAARGHPHPAASDRRPHRRGHPGRRDGLRPRQLPASRSHPDRDRARLVRPRTPAAGLAGGHGPRLLRGRGQPHPAESGPAGAGRQAGRRPQPRPQLRSTRHRRVQRPRLDRRRRGNPACSDKLSKRR